MSAPEHVAMANEIVQSYGAGAMSEDSALRALMNASGLDEGAAAFLLIDRWNARHDGAHEQPAPRDGAADDEDWWTR